MTEVKVEDTYPIHARVGTTEVSLGPTVPARKFKRKFFNLFLNEHSGTTGNYLDLTYVSAGVTSTMRIYIGAYGTLELKKEKVAGIEADPGTDVRVVAHAADIEVMGIVADI